MIVSAVAQGAAPQTGREQLSGAAKAFEAIFVRQILAAARKTDFGGDLFGGQSMDTFRQMQDERFAEIASQSGAFGIASMIEAQLSPSRLREGLGEGRLLSANAALSQEEQALPPSPDSVSGGVHGR